MWLDLYFGIPLQFRVVYSIGGVILFVIVVLDVVRLNQTNQEIGNPRTQVFDEIQLHDIKAKKRSKSGLKVNPDTVHRVSLKRAKT